MVRETGFMKIAKTIFTAVVTTALFAGCQQSESDWSDCSKVSNPRERTQCLAHKESTKETDMSKIPSQPRKW
jgi:hypothetical protein